MRRHAFIVIIAVILLRLPFLNTAAQWDDFNYLASARYALTNPLHPSHVEYAFMGEMHSMRGHPHPPGTAWILALCMAVLGPFREVPFHIAFLLFPVTAALSMLALARRFVPERALDATLLFLAVPASMVSATSFESDLPLLAFWTLSMALFLDAVERRSARRLAAAVTAIAATSMVAYTAFLIAPICVVYLWMRRCAWRPAWVALATPFVVIGGFQFFEMATSGDLPAGVLMGHFQNQGLQRLEMKVKNAIALTGHLGLMLCPLVWLAMGRQLRPWQWLAAFAAAGAVAASLHDESPLLWVPLAFGLVALIWTVSRMRESDDRFLAAWVTLYFAAAIVIFFAGAARYLLPMAAPLAILATRALAGRRDWLRAAAALNVVLGLSMAWVNHQQWEESRRFAAEAMEAAKGHRVWAGAEWGLRHYAEMLGAKPLLKGMVMEPGDMILASELSGNIAYHTGGNRMRTVRVHEIRPALPVRIAGIEAQSAYATVGFGLRAIDFSRGVVDRLTLTEAVGVAPRLTWLPMNAPEAEFQTVAGVFSLEDSAWRWAEKRSLYRLKPPTAAKPLAAEIYIPDNAPGRTVRLEVNGGVVAEQTYPQPGSYTLISEPLNTGGGAVTVTLTIDRDFQPAGDSRRLAVIVRAIGFQP